MKITRDSQWQIVNKQNWGGRIMNRLIELEGGDVIEAVIYWRNESETITNEYGVKYQKATGLYNPCLHISYWKPAKVGGMMSSGLGDFYVLNGSYARRTIKPLQMEALKIDAHQIETSAVNKTAPSVIIGA